MNYSIVDLLYRWNSLMMRNTPEEENTQRKHDKIFQAFADLHLEYMDSKRHYHSLEHIADCLKSFDEVKHCLDNADSVEIALWYHDVVYETGNTKSELDSADNAANSLLSLGVAWDVVDYVSELIQSTQYSVTLVDPFTHRKVVTTNDILHMRDIDFSAFGKDYDAVLKNGAQIYRESLADGISANTFFKGRVGFLGLVADPEFKLYYTDHFKELEEKAKLNVATELRQLSASGLLLYKE